MSTHDVVIIGAGINGIVAAAVLARGGLDVALLDRNERIGGFIESAELTEPGFTHDTYSSWHPLFVTSEAYAEFGEQLHRHGLRYGNVEDRPDAGVTASVGRDGVSVRALRDPEATAAQFEFEEDRAAYIAMVEGFGRFAPALGAAMGRNVRRASGVGAVLDLARRAGLRRSETLVRETLTSGRSYCARTFAGREVDQLWVPWLLHNGLTPDSTLGGFLLQVFAGSTHAAGLPVVEGGASSFLRAWESLLAELGVTVVTGAPVAKILVEGRGRRSRVTGVQIGARDDRVGSATSGRREVYRARRAVLASVSPGALYRHLLPPQAVTPTRRLGAEKYRAGRAAMQIHLSLSEAMRWHDPTLDEVPLVHISDGSNSTAIACAQAQAGLLPTRPTVVVGRQHVLDPSRVPPGQGSLWVQLQEVPGHLRGDAADRISVPGAGRWTAEVARSYADRVIAQIGEQSPNLAGAVREVRVISPADLEARNPNAIEGDPYGGSAEIDQMLLWRPFPSGAAGTGVKRLHHIGAAVHPGPGLGGASGLREAKKVLSSIKRGEKTRISHEERQGES